jgi:hypothetical protein
MPRLTFKEYLTPFSSLFRTAGSSFFLRPLLPSSAHHHHTALSHPSSGRHAKTNVLQPHAASSVHLPRQDILSYTDFNFPSPPTHYAATAISSVSATSDPFLKNCFVPHHPMSSPVPQELTRAVAVHRSTAAASEHSHVKLSPPPPCCAPARVSRHFPHPTGRCPAPRRCSL